MDSDSKKKIRNYIVYCIAGLIAIVAIWLIFAPSGENLEGENNLNTELPEAEDENIPDNKAKAYEDLAHDKLVDAQMHSLDDEFNTILDEQDSVQEEEISQQKSEQKLDKTANEAKEVVKTLQRQRETSSMRSTPNYDEVERLRRENEDLKRKKTDEENQQRLQTAKEEMVSLLQLAQGQQAQPTSVPNENLEQESQQATVMPVTDEVEGIATSLNQNSTRRNAGFYGMGSDAVRKNTIKASVYGRQVIEDGQNVRLRLSEPMIVSGQIVQAGSILVGTGKIGVDRLFISINSVEYQGVISKVALDVYDIDGQQGLFVPGSMEMEAGREIGVDVASAVGGSASTGVSSMFTQQSAVEQIKTDVGRGVVRGTFNYIGRKLQQIKVTVQDKHKVLLVPQK